MQSSSAAKNTRHAPSEGAQRAGAAALARIEQRPRPKVHTSQDAIRNQGETWSFTLRVSETVMITANALIGRTQPITSPSRSGSRYCFYINPNADVHQICCHVNRLKTTCLSFRDTKMFLFHLPVKHSVNADTTAYCCVICDLNWCSTVWFCLCACSQTRAGGWGSCIGRYRKSGLSRGLFFLVFVSGL